MVTEKTITQNGNENQTVGKALIIYGSVQAQSPDGATRILQPNSPVFANDRIITGDDGMISIVFGDSGNTQLDLGRMSDVLIDEDVFQGDIPADINDATAQVEKIQQALLNGLDPTQDLEAPAAGPAAAAVVGAGGGHVYTKFELTGEEVTPVSGAETTGIERTFLDPNLTVLEPAADTPILPAPTLTFAAAPPPAAPDAPADTPPDIPPPLPPDVDTVPVAGTVIRAIDEENFTDGTNPNTALLTTTGTLADLGVNFGGDLPGTLDFGGGNTLVIDSLGDSTITVTGLYGTLTVNDDGSWSYTLNDNIVHPDNDPNDGDGTTGPDDSLPELFPFLAIDADGDSAPGSVTINIYDDGPIATGAEIDRVLEEEALDNYLDPNPNVVGSDGNPDETDGPEDATQPDSAIVTGSFASLVNVGADNPGTFSVVSVSDLPPLFSQGGAITYVLNGDTIEAWVIGQGEELPGETFVSEQFDGFSEDRLVFTLEVLPNGDYTFTMLDQLDHVAPGEGLGADENIDLISGDGSVNSIDFSTAIQVTDTDGDSIIFSPGTLTFTLVDDIPVANEEFRGIEIVALEDGLSQESGDSGDLSDGNRESGETLSDDEDNGSTGSLRGIFSVGADQGATYGIATSSDILSGLDTLFSKGDQLFYSSNGSTLTANTVADGSGRTAFTLTVNPDGSWSFDLDDQLDHVDDLSNTENWALQGSTAESGGLDISSILTITDFDGDTITGAGTGAFVVSVQDDIPVIDQKGILIAVQEDALGNTGDTDDASTGILEDPAGDVEQVSGNLAHLVSSGADEALTFGLTDVPVDFETGLTSHNNEVTYAVAGGTLTASAAGVTVFTFSVDANGDYTFDLEDQLDHSRAGDAETLSFNLGSFVEATDYDGDAVTLDGLIGISVENDVPSVVEKGITLSVQEDALGNAGDADDASLGLLDSAGDVEHVTGNLASLVAAPGADEPVSFSLADVPVDFESGLTSHGNEVIYAVAGNTLTASAAGVTVFTFTVDANGDYTFDLEDQVDHNQPDNSEISNSGSGDAATLTFDLGSFVTATDADGDTVTLDGLVNISVENDVPVAENTGTSFFVSEYAGFNNVIGTYVLDEFGNPVNAQLLIASSNTAADGGMGENEHQLGAYDAGTKFFIIADGRNTLGDLTGKSLNFVANAGPGPAWVLEIDGSTAYSAPVYYMDVALNADGQEHFKDENGSFLNAVPAEGGEIRIEDLSLGDADYDDTVLRVEMGPVVDEANLSDGTDPDTAALIVHGNLFSGMGGVKLTIGADEPGTLTVASESVTLNNDGTIGSSQNLILDGTGDFITVLSEAGTLIVNDDGTWAYTLTDNTLVHPDNDPGGNDHSDGDSDRGTGDQVQDIFDLTFTDADGDQVAPQIVININDDGPEANEDTRGLHASVEEDDMSLVDGDLSDGINEDGSINHDETSGGPGSLATLFNVGADNENVTYGLTSDFSSIGSLKSHGEALNYTVSSDVIGDTLTASTSYGDVFTLQIKADGSWNFDLKDQLDHVADGNTEGSILEGSVAPSGGIDFSSVVVVTDADGDKAYGALDNSFVIDVQDDIPVAEEVSQIPANLNLVLILDNSGSMYSNKITWEGQANTTRIVALQSAVVSLLGTLEASAADNIRINIVEYNTDAHSLGTFDIKVNGVVADAQAAIDAVNDLIAPNGYDVYTNYEAGYQQALQWTASGDPLTAADVTGDIVNQVLFFSDGDPNKYNDPDQGQPGGPDPDPNFGSTASASYALGQVTGSDGSNELAALNAWADSVRAIGINVDNGQDDRLDTLDGTGDAINIQSGSELTTILPSLLTTSDPLISAMVQEDDLTVDNDLPGDPDSATGNNEDGSVNADEAASSADPQNLANLFESGADEPLTFELATETSNLPELWSAGEKLSYTVNGNTLTATAHGEQIFTFTVNANGSWHFDLDGQLDHVAGEGENLALVSGPDATAHVGGIDLSSLIVATDADHDQVMANAGAFVIEIEDDIPIAGDPQDAILANEDGNSLVADLNIDFGADGPGRVSITPNTHNIGSSNKVVDNEGNYLYIDGQKLYWHDNGNGSWQAQTAAAVVGFIVAPESDVNGFTGNYTVELQNAVDDVVNTFSKSFGGSGGGNAVQRDLYSGDVHIAVTAIDPGSSDPDKVNWSTQGMGVGNEFVEQDNTGTSQHPTYVTEQLVVDFSSTSTGDALLMIKAKFGLDHLDKATGGQHPAPAEVAHWTAYNGSDIVGTGSVTGTALGSSDGADQFLTIDDHNTTGAFDKVVFSAENTITDYRVTSVEGSYAEPSEHELDFNVTATDGDGDSVQSSFDVTIDSDGHITGGDEAEVISGSSGDDTIDGGGGNDVISGHGGDDTIDGGAGDDTVAGGAGDDTVAGGAGDDTVDGGEETSAPAEGNDTVSGGEGSDTLDTAEESAGEVTDYDPGPPEEDQLDTLVPPPEVV